MKTAITMILMSLTLSCSAAYARSSSYDANGFVFGFAPLPPSAAEKVPAVSVPEPVIAGEDADPEEPGGAEQLGPALTLAPQDPPAGGLDMPEDLKTRPADYDEGTALRLARTARNRSIGSFTGWCYSYVADAMELTGIIRRDQWSSLGIGVNAAADFAYWANRNPKTLRGQLNLAKIETPARATDLPMGAIVVYNRGVCGFSGRSGHIEVKVAPNLLCSDGCQPAYQECFGSAGVRAGISVYVPVKKAPKKERRFCRLTGNADGNCRYKCSDGSDYEMPMKRPSPFDAGLQSQPDELCKQAVFVY